MSPTKEQINHPHVDCVVIGSGVAGALVAKRLSQSGINVQILEAGGTIERQQAVERYEHAWNRNLTSPFPDWPKADYPLENSAEKYYGNSGTTNYRPSFLKLVGGTTWHWTGITPRFLPADFEMQHLYKVGIDWPITYTDLEPYYVQAEHALGVAGNSQDNHGSPRSADYPMPAIPLPYSDQVIAKRLQPYNITIDALPAARNSRDYAGRPQCCGHGTCTPICPIGASYSANVDVQKAINHGAHLTDHAVVYRFDINEQGNISRAYFKRPDGHSNSITANFFVLACNSIETPRLMLLAAQEACPQGLANRSGMVGKNLMDHVLFQASYRLDTPLYMGRGPLSVGTILQGRAGSFRSEYAAAKIFLGNDRNAAKVANDLLSEAKNWPNLLEHMRHKLIHQGVIGGEVEQLPMESNRLTLDKSRVDGHGFALPTINLQLSSYTEKGLEKWQTFTHDLIHKIGGSELQSGFSLTSHHPCGTARMGLDPTTSVVNAQCKSHDHDNLYVASSSVFPTMGTANPTLTIAALALRIADDLKKRIKA
ncbi:MAG: GMC family oxidoreductase [Mariprofundaceae bacterium]|nr:GMC family oxidoreductase [Mariprofundaceae bacterium]